jgi:hypothetical protein
VHSHFDQGTRFHYSGAGGGTLSLLAGLQPSRKSLFGETAWLNSNKAAALECTLEVDAESTEMAVQQDDNNKNNNHSFGGGGPSSFDTDRMSNTSAASAASATANLKRTEAEIVVSQDARRHGSFHSQSF